MTALQRRRWPLPAKKSRTAVEKLIEAQARGKKVSGAHREKKRSRAGELDARVSKATKALGDFN